MAEESFLQIAQALKAGAPVAQGFADRGAARANAGMFRTQAAQARDSAAYDEVRARRASRAAIAQQVASASAEGQGDSSAIAVIEQNRVNMIADALAIQARGEVEAAGYESRASASEYAGDQAFNSGLAGTGAELLLSSYERRRRALKVDG